MPVPATEHGGAVGPSRQEVVADLIARLARGGHSVAAAESLTGGLLTAALTGVPGSSAVVRGGVVAYATDAKTSLLGVAAELVARVGPVDPAVAHAMAVGVRERLGATYGVATTGEAGPDSATGQPVGTVHVAACGPNGTVSRALHLPGDRTAIRDGAVDAALDLLAEVVGSG